LAFYTDLDTPEAEQIRTHLATIHNESRPGVAGDVQLPACKA
jgi:hypothetical protein